MTSSSQPTIEQVTAVQESLSTLLLNSGVRHSGSIRRLPITGLYVEFKLDAEPSGVGVPDIASRFTEVLPDEPEKPNLVRGKIDGVTVHLEYCAALTHRFAGDA